MSSWFLEHETGSVAVSSRVRLARNIESLAFPSRMNNEQRKLLLSSIGDALKTSTDPIASELKLIEMESIETIERIAMAERHIISPAFASAPPCSAVLLNSDESISVMIGEEDHLRIQVLLPGFKVKEAYDIANKVDNFLASCVNFAFDEKLGYLTECPTNLGIGLRASVMLHLPVLEGNGELASIIENAGKIGLTIRGLYGEGSSSAASMYQLSNQITLGITEENAIENLSAIANQIIEKEQVARKELDSIKTADIVWRALGIIKNSRIMTSDEMMKLLSRVKLGTDMGIIEEEIARPIRLMVECQPGMLQKRFGEMTPADRDICRAEYLREQYK